MLGNKGGAVNTPPMPEQQAPAPAAKAVKPGAVTPDRVDLLVTDGAGKPLAGVRYVMETPDGTKVEGKTDASGTIARAESVAGLGAITFPDVPDVHVDRKE
jgi:uncharacterized protein (DUF2345 family)